MKRPKLTVEKRTILGKKVKQLRRKDVLPANIYGKEMKSLPVQVSYPTFSAIYAEVKQTGLVDVMLDGKVYPVLIHDIHTDPISALTLHADFYQVDLKEKITTMVPFVAEGEPKAVTEKLGLLLQTVSEIEVEALPADLPENITVNVEHLAAVGDQIVVSDLKAPAGVTIVSDPGQVIIKIDELVSEEAKADAKAEEEKASEAKTESEEEKTENVEEVKEEAVKIVETKEDKKQTSKE